MAELMKVIIIEEDNDEFEILMNISDISLIVPFMKPGEKYKSGKAYNAKIYMSKRDRWFTTKETYEEVKKKMEDWILC